MTDNRLKEERSLAERIVDDVFGDDVPRDREHKADHLADLVQHEALPDHRQPHVLRAVDQNGGARAEGNDVALRLEMHERKRLTRGDRLVRAWLRDLSEKTVFASPVDQKEGDLQ